MYEVVEFAQAYAGRLLLGGTIFTLLELVIPATRYRLMSRLRGLGFWLIYIGITSVALVAWSQIWQQVGWTAPIKIPPDEITALTNDYLRIGAVIVGALAAAAVYDFFYYWFHRLQHANAYLWSFHKVHHAIEEMSALNSNHHFTEELFRIPLVTVPFSLIFAVDGGAPPVIVATLLGVHGWFLHSCSSINIGPVRFVIADNRWHRIHHSIEERHHNKNFGAATVIWDLVFRTAHLPARHEWPRVGVSDMPEPKTLCAFLLAPWHRRERATPGQHVLYPMAGAAIAALLLLAGTSARDMLRGAAVAAAPPPIDNLIDFSAQGNGDSFVLGGLAAQEANGRWIDREARLSFRTVGAEADFLAISGFGFIHGRAQTQRVRIHVNDQLIAVKEVVASDNGKPFCVPIPLGQAGPTVAVRLETPDQVRPIDVGFNQDKRSVGFFLQRLQMVDGQRDPACSQATVVAVR